MDVSYVKLLLELVSMPRGIIAMVMAGNVAPTVAIQEYRKHGAETVNVLNHGLAAAQAAAAAAGKPVEKAKYTPKHKPGARWAKVVKSKSEPLYMVVKAVAADPGFKGLAEDTRNSLQELIDSLKAKEEELAQKEAEIQAQLAKANAEGGDGRDPAGTRHIRMTTLRPERRRHDSTPSQRSRCCSLRSLPILSGLEIQPGPPHGWSWLKATQTPRPSPQRP